MFRVTSCYLQYVVSCVFITYENRKLTSPAIKALVKVIYTGFKSEIVDDTGIEQVDAPVAGPVGDKLLLKFAAVKQNSQWRRCQTLYSELRLHMVIHAKKISHSHL